VPPITCLDYFRKTKIHRSAGEGSQHGLAWQWFRERGFATGVPLQDSGLAQESRLVGAKRQL
jgi:hypothetical protein